MIKWSQNILIFKPSNNQHYISYGAPWWIFLGNKLVLPSHTKMGRKLYLRKLKSDWNVTKINFTYFPILNFFPSSFPFIIPSAKSTINPRAYPSIIILFSEPSHRKNGKKSQQHNSCMYNYIFCGWFSSIRAITKPCHMPFPQSPSVASAPLQYYPSAPQVIIIPPFPLSPSFTCKCK